MSIDRGAGLALLTVLLACGDGGSPEAGSEGPASGSSTRGSTSSDGPAATDEGTGGRCEGGWWSGGDGAEDTGFGMGDDMPLPLAVFEIQQGNVPDRTLVQLSSVIVTTPSAPSELLPGFELFVQEPAGGPYSGLRLQAEDFDLGALLSVGDTVDVIGRVSRSDGYVLLEIAAAEDLAVTGTAAAPTPTVVEATVLSWANPMARPYEGVVVRVEMATVTDDDPCDGEFELDDTVRVDDRFVPAALASPVHGQVLTAVEGVLVYTTNGYELAPPDGASVHQ